jgi:hypothetical protein
MVEIGAKDSILIVGMAINQCLEHSSQQKRNAAAFAQHGLP